MLRFFLTPLLLCLLLGNKHKWVPLMIEVKSEGPRERSASRNNSRQNETPRMPPNTRNDLRGQSEIYLNVYGQNPAGRNWTRSGWVRRNFSLNRSGQAWVKIIIGKYFYLQLFIGKLLAKRSIARAGFRFGVNIFQVQAELKFAVPNQGVGTQR